MSQLQAVADHVESLKAKMPADGMTAAAFEAFALGAVPPTEIGRAIRYLHNRGTVHVSRARGRVRVFAERPTEGDGSRARRDRADVALASIVGHFRRLGEALAARDAAKACGDAVKANEARDDLDTTAACIVALVSKHEARGVPPTLLRQAMAATFAPGALKFLTGFEPALAVDANRTLALANDDRSRIANGLDDVAKVRALVGKAQRHGLTKSALQQAIRPKLAADALAVILINLAEDGAIEARQVRVRGTVFATRYFGTGMLDA